MISITFDDGYYSHLEAAKELTKLGVKGTFYITTSFLDKKDYLNIDDILFISKDGHEIGSHGHTHANLVITPFLFNELKKSKNILEGIINNKVVSFAYPYGWSNIFVRAFVKKFYKNARIFRPYGIEKIPPQNKYKIKTIGFSSLNKNLVFSKIESLKEYEWLILTIHNIEDIPSSKWSTSKNDFGMLLNKIVQSKHKVQTIRSVLY